MLKFFKLLLNLEWRKAVVVSSKSIDPNWSTPKHRLREFEKPKARWVIVAVQQDATLADWYFDLWVQSFERIDRNFSLTSGV